MKESTIIDLIFELQKKCSLENDKFIEKLGISQAEYNMFICLKNCKHFNSYSVAEKMSLSLSRVSRIIEKMVNKGFLNRTINKEDRRAIDIKMTKKGESILQSIVVFLKERENYIENQLNDADISKIKSSFNKLIDLV
jgi:DNA-binding MarR family transcriptional regulator